MATDLFVHDTQENGSVFVVTENSILIVHDSPSNDGEIVTIAEQTILLVETDHQSSTSNTSSSTTFTFEQSVASDTWNVMHNLDKYPSVSIVDSGGNLVDGEVKYVTSNRILINFTSPFSGKAYLN